MTLLIAIEGADGAGKATAASLVRDLLVIQGLTAGLVSFPRYRDTVSGTILGDFLSGRMSKSVTAKAAAVLYAMDRLESVAFVAQAAASNDVLLFDRYIASNMVYQASKVPPDEATAFMHWILQLETEMFGVIPPDLSIYLDTTLEAAQALMLLKAKRSYTDRHYDEHEADTALQHRVRRNYEAIASSGLGGPWRVVRTASGNRLRQPQDIASEIVGHVLEFLGKEGREAKDRMINQRA